MSRVTLPRIGIGTAGEDGEGVEEWSRGFAGSEPWPYCCAAEVPYIRIEGVSDVGSDIVCSIWRRSPPAEGCWVIAKSRQLYP